MDESLNRKWTYSQTHTHTRRCSTSQRIILPCIIHEMHIIASIMIAVTHTQATHAHTHTVARPNGSVYKMYLPAMAGGIPEFICSCVFVWADDLVFVGIPLLC